MGNVLTFDVGGTYVKYALVDSQGQVSSKGLSKTPSTLDELMGLIKQQVKWHSNKHIQGIAMSTPGSVSKEGIIYGASALPYIHGPNMKQLIEKETGFKTTIENDANCAGLAEVWKGAAKDKKDVAVVTIGTGIGGALIKDGMIHKGDSLHGGEFGYMILNPHNLGSGMNTFSEVASTHSILKRVSLRKNVDISTLSGEKVFALAEQGDDVSKQAISEFMTMLSIGLYNIQYAYDPELILIGGGISQRNQLIDEIQVELDRIVDQVDVATITPKIKHCAFHADANLIGAVYHFLQVY